MMRINKTFSSIDHLRDKDHKETWMSNREKEQLEYVLEKILNYVKCFPTSVLFKLTIFSKEIVNGEC